MNNKTFSLEKTSSTCGARTGTLVTPHGLVRTPVFMPVGTQGSVKTISQQELEQIDAQIILSNAYHLYLRPGTDIIEAAGGIHRFIGWDRPLLTDSGGFQIFSLATMRHIADDGVEFQSHLDGSKHFITPEKAVEIQQKIGADIIMCFDECTPYPCTHDYAERSMRLSLAWARRCKDRWCAAPSRVNPGQLLFGIVQGSVYTDLREISTRETVAIDFPGYAVGGLSVGETKDEIRAALGAVLPLLPADKPRYAMGVGTPEDIWECVEQGIDMFDCVLPTRNGRNGQAFTSTGKVNIKNAEYGRDFGPLDAACGCPACAHYNRAYLSHLFRSQEILALRLLALHNLYFMIKLTEIIRKSIESDTFSQAKKDFLSKYSEATPCV